MACAGHSGRGRKRIQAGGGGRISRRLPWDRRVLFESQPSAQGSRALCRRGRAHRGSHRANAFSDRCRKGLRGRRLHAQLRRDSFVLRWNRYPAIQLPIWRWSRASMDPTATCKSAKAAMDQAAKTGNSDPYDLDLALAEAAAEAHDADTQEDALKDAAAERPREAKCSWRWGSSTSTSRITTAPRSLCSRPPTPIPRPVHGSSSAAPRKAPTITTRPRRPTHRRSRSIQQSRDQQLLRRVQTPNGQGEGGANGADPQSRRAIAAARGTTLRRQRLVHAA